MQKYSTQRSRGRRVAGTGPTAPPPNDPVANPGIDTQELDIWSDEPSSLTRHKDHFSEAKSERGFPWQMQIFFTKTKTRVVSIKNKMYTAKNKQLLFSNYFFKSF